MTDHLWTAIVNPAAGRGRALKKWRALDADLAAHGIRSRLYVTQQEEHVHDAVADVMSGGMPYFISIGGDGSHHVLINAIMRCQPQKVQPVIALLSAGSGNDWARTLGVDGDVRKCAQMLKSNKTISHPAGVITSLQDGAEHVRYFVNVAGMALDGRVVETYPAFFRRFPFLPGYLIAGLRQLIAYRAKSIRVTSAEQTIASKMLTVHAGIGRFSGGGMQFVPHANPERQDLAITCVQSMSKLRLFANIYRLYTGSLLAHPRVAGFHTSTLRVKGDRIPVEADGEFIGYTPVTVQCVRDAFRVVVPEARLQ